MYKYICAYFELANRQREKEWKKWVMSIFFNYQATHFCLNSVTYRNRLYVRVAFLSLINRPQLDEWPKSSISHAFIPKWREKLQTSGLWLSYLVHFITFKVRGDIKVFSLERECRNVALTLQRDKNVCFLTVKISCSVPKKFFSTSYKLIRSQDVSHGHYK